MLQLLDVNHAYQREPVLRGIILEIATGETLCSWAQAAAEKPPCSGHCRPRTARLGRDSVRGAPISDRPIHQRDFGLSSRNTHCFPT
jgi:hypothetical protein